jgi:ADP-ribosylglycohydrolase
MERVRLALDGLSIGDAFGSQFFIPANERLLFGPRREDPPVEEEFWRYTDDTEMALGIAEVLGRHGRIEQDDLAATFARRFRAEMYRGYGPMAIRILAAIADGGPWREVSAAVFGGEGSLGNGAAMRVAPVAAFFADDPLRAAAEACLSAEVTHRHPEGVAGAVAVAAAVASAWQLRDRAGDDTARAELFAAALDLTPAGATRRGLEEARELSFDEPVATAAQALGNGSRVTAPDTVPFCVWCAARHLANYPDAIWNTVRGGGDIDTTAAIVGGIVVMAVGRGAIPAEWLAAREPLGWEGS